MGHPGKAAQGGLDHGGLQPQLEGGGGYQRHVLTVVGPGQGQGGCGEQCPGGCHHHPPVDPEAGLQAVTQLIPGASGDPVGPDPAAGMGAQIGIIGVEQLLSGVIQQGALDRPVRLQRSMPLEMVGGERGPEAQAWRQLR